jgi:hypothetical protein
LPQNNVAMLLKLLFVIGLVFAVLAGAIAFLITYQEYRRHSYEGWKLWRPSLNAAVFAFAFFLLLSLVLGVVLAFVV